MNPDRVASLHASLKSVLEDTRRLNQAFVAPESPAVQSEIFANQHSLVSMLRLELLRVDKELGDIEKKVERLKQPL